MRTLVTEANGHLGFNLVQALLLSGQRVRASVRSLADFEKTAPLRALAGVELVAATLDAPAQLRAAMDGVDLVFHAAAEFAYVLQGGPQRLLRAGIAGAEHAVRAAADAKVSKMVLTSSVVALPMTVSGAAPSDETDWNTEFEVPYWQAKTQGERRAWEVASELGLNLVTVLPASLFGPGFRRNTPTIDLVEGLAKGIARLGVPDMTLPWVDVRDAAAAHLLAAECDCEGRFIACNDHSPSIAEIIAVLRTIEPSVPRPLMPMPEFMLGALPLLDRINHWLLGTPRLVTPELLAHMEGRRPHFSNQRIKRLLGWAPRIGLASSLADTALTLRANGRLPARD